MQLRQLVPWTGMAGCVLGVCITSLLKLALLPSTAERWPSYWENSVEYFTDMLKAGYSFKNDTYLMQADWKLQEITDEAEFLYSSVRLLCYSVDLEMTSLDHSLAIIQTWSRHCNKALFFYSNIKLPPLLKERRIKPSENTDLVPFTIGQNQTVAALVRKLDLMVAEYDWVVYVPSRVFLVPANLRYYIHSTRHAHGDLTFLGRPSVAKLSGQWGLSDDSPLAMSRSVVSYAAAHLHRDCHVDSMNDPLCLLESCSQKPVNIRDKNGNEVFAVLSYGNALVEYASAQPQRIVTRFPASIHLDGPTASNLYRKLFDMEYYLHHLAAYGNHPIRGSLTSTKKPKH